MLAGCGTVPRSHRSCAAVALRSRRAAMPTQNWREVYELALLELDTSKLPGRVEAALRAIQQRLLQKETLSRKECEETDDALRALCRGHATARGVSKQRVAFGGYASDDPQNSCGCSFFFFRPPPLIRLLVLSTPRFLLRRATFVSLRLGHKSRIRLCRTSSSVFFVEKTLVCAKGLVGRTVLAVYRSLARLTTSRAH